MDSPLEGFHNSGMSLALFLALVTSESRLSAPAMRALSRLREAQLEAQRGARGALVKVSRLDDGRLDMAKAGAESPLAGDFLALLALQLLEDLPRGEAAMRLALKARREGLALAMLASALWRPDGEDAFGHEAARVGLGLRVLEGLVWAALKPLYEALARAWLRASPASAGVAACPLCGAEPFASVGTQLRCGVCETGWSAPDACACGACAWRTSPGPQPLGATRAWCGRCGRQRLRLGPEFADCAFNAGPLVALVRALDARAA